MKSRLCQIFVSSFLLIITQMPGCANNSSQSDAGDAILLVNDRLGAEKYSDALTAIDDYLKRNPDFTQFYLQKGYAQFKLKQYQQALVSLNHCLKKGYQGVGTKAVSSLNAEAWLYIGHCQLAQGNRDAAIRSFKNSFDLYPGLEEGFKTLKKMTAGTSLSAVAAARLELVLEAKKFVSDPQTMK